METTPPTAIELAKLHETKMVGAKIELDHERRAVEALLIGKTAINRDNRALGPLTISLIRLTAHGSVQVWGKKKRHSVKSFLIGGLGTVELLAIKEPVA